MVGLELAPLLFLQAGQDDGNVPVLLAVVADGALFGELVQV